MKDHPALNTQGKQNVNLDVEKDMDDDGHRPLREMSKLYKDRTMSMDSEALVHVQSLRSLVPLNEGGFAGDD